MENNRRKD
jgi:hypothetical protein